VSRLVAGGRRVTLVHRSCLFRCGTVRYPSRTSVVRNVVGVGHRISLNHRPINEGGVNDCGIHVDHCGVIRKVPATPLAARKSDTKVAAAVIDSAVIADLAAPVAIVKAIVAVVKAPVAGRPKSTLVRGRHPGAGNPEIVAFGVRPVARGPQQIRLRARGLLIDRQFRWSKIDADSELGVHGRRNYRHHQRKQKQTGRAKEPHGKTSSIPQVRAPKVNPSLPARHEPGNYPARVAGERSSHLVKSDHADFRGINSCAMNPAP
jgi:hypothetical protein